MNAKEIAEKIVAEMDSRRQHGCLTNWIAFELEAYAAEKVSDQVEKEIRLTQSCVALADLEGYERGYKAGMEDAITVISVNAHCQHCYERLEEAIRAASLGNTFVKGETFNHRDGQSELDKFNASLGKESK